MILDPEALDEMRFKVAGALKQIKEIGQVVDEKMKKDGDGGAGKR